MLTGCLDLGGQNATNKKVLAVIFVLKGVILEFNHRNAVFFN